MGALPIDGKPIKLNGAFHTLCAILRFVVASAAEAELGALFLNCQEGIIFRTTLEDLGHPQPRIPVHAIMQQPLASQTKPSKDSDREQWK
jgi:hypothetical protein